MAEGQGRLTDEKVQTILGNLLLVGVIAAAILVFLGGLVFLYRHGFEIRDYSKFEGEPPELTTVAGIARASVRLSGRGIIQLGLLVLVATPVARVVFSQISFLIQRDYTYVVITMIVLAVLVYSLAGGGL
jgi:uncharacterized membrane protein